MSFAAIFLAAVAIVLSGLGIIAAALPPSILKRGRPTLIFLGVSIGLGLWSITYMLLIVSRSVRPGTLIAKDAIMAIVGMALLGTMRRPPDSDQAPRRRPPGTGIAIGAFVVLAIIASAGFAAQSMRHPNGDWDAWTIWNARARFLFRTDDPHLMFHPALPHADYPTLLPGLIAQCWIRLGGESRCVPVIVAAILTALCVGLLVSAIAWLRDIRLALLAGIVLLGTPEFTQQAANQYADVPLALYLLASCVLMTVGTRQTCGSAGAFILCGLAASLMAWTKNEGTLYSSCMAASIVLVAQGRPAAQRLRDIMLFAAGAAPLVIFLWWFKHTLAPADDLILASSVQGALARLRDPSRYAHVVGALLWRTILLNRWNLYLTSIPLIWLACLRRGAAMPVVRRLMIALVLMLAGLGMVYVLTPFDLEWQISSSMSRLIVQLWPSALFITAMALPVGVGRVAFSDDRDMISACDKARRE